jgi:hypothetical protein
MTKPDLFVLVEVDFFLWKSLEKKPFFGALFELEEPALEVEGIFKVRR